MLILNMKEPEFTNEQHTDLILRGIPFRYGYKFAINLAKFDCIEKYHVALTALVLN
jgi:hypothetical protein